MKTLSARLIVLAMIASALSACTPQETYDLVIKNVVLFDGHQDRGIVNIAINADTIAAISGDVLAADSVIDGTGMFVIPGLVNAHIHASRIEQLQQGFDFGILTVINLHTGLEDRELEWKQISRDSMGFSTLYGVGHAATVPGGHPTQFSPGMETVNDTLSAEEWVERRIAKDVDFIKIIRESHDWMGEPPLPSLDFGQIQELIDLAHKKGYKALIHATTAEDMIRIAPFKPDGFMHMPEFKDEYPFPESFYEAIAGSGAFVVPTGGISLKSLEGAPPFVRNWVQENLLDAEQRAAILKKLHDRGVMIVAGTDAQEGQMDFGADYFLELELYKMAGLSNLEVLQTATGNAAKAFGLPIGELKVGSKADMVLLTANPLEDLDNLQKVEKVWKNGRTQ